MYSGYDLRELMYGHYQLGPGDAKMLTLNTDGIRACLWEEQIRPHLDFAIVGRYDRTRPRNEMNELRPDRHAVKQRQPAIASVPPGRARLPLHLSRLPTAHRPGEHQQVRFHDHHRLSLAGRSVVSKDFSRKDSIQMIYTIGTGEGKKQLKMGTLQAMVQALDIKSILDWRRGTDGALSADALRDAFPGEAYKLRWQSVQRRPHYHWRAQPSGGTERHQHAPAVRREDSGRLQAARETGAAAHQARSEGVAHLRRRNHRGRRVSEVDR